MAPQGLKFLKIEIYPKIYLIVSNTNIDRGQFKLPDKYFSIGQIC